MVGGGRRGKGGGRCKVGGGRWVVGGGRWVVGGGWWDSVGGGGEEAGGREVGEKLHTYGVGVIQALNWSLASHVATPSKHRPPITTPATLREAWTGLREGGVSEETGGCEALAGPSDTRVL